MVCDVIFHPKTLKACEDSEEMKHFVCGLAMQRVAEKNELQFVTDSGKCMCAQCVVKATTAILSSSRRLSIKIQQLSGFPS